MIRIGAIVRNLLRKPEPLIFLFSLWVVLSCNFGYWQVVAANNMLENMSGTVFSTWMALLTLGLISLVALLLAVAGGLRYRVLQRG